MIACLGVNPSTAHPDKLDSTVTSVKNITESNGYDGWLMINVYPLRSTDPNHLPLTANEKIHQENLMAIRECLMKFSIEHVWLAYGDLIDHRPYLRSCLEDVIEVFTEMNVKFFIVGTVTKKGNPRHPLYKRKDTPLTPRE